MSDCIKVKQFTRLITYTNMQMEDAGLWWNGSAWVERPFIVNKGVKAKARMQPRRAWSKHP
jgi:hypothetical protein